MGNNNLYKIENTLRSIAKRCKTVKYSLGLAILFLMLGGGAFSEEINNESTQNTILTREEIASSKENLKNSVGNLQSKIDSARAENQKTLKGLRLELIQLMEQGDQVVKSPWASWQFGLNYMYSKWNGAYKGKGDKAEKYVFNGIYRRGNWKVKNAMNIAASNGPKGAPITPGNENTSSWKTTGNNTKGGVKIKKDMSIDSGTNGNREWGLVKLRNIKEPTNEVEILAKISPKDVSKARLDIPVKVQAPAEIKAPVVNPNVNKPKEAPVVKLPKASSPEIPNDPTLNPNPTINIMKVNQVGNITVNPNPVTPVDFFIAPGGPHQHLYSSTEYDHTYDNKTTNLSIGPLYFWGIIPSGNTTLINANLNVINPISRAIVVDEGRAAAGDTFTYRGGTIRLTQSKNAGIDVQGTHMGSYSNIYQMKVINQGNIIGVGGTGISEHAAFAFNNFDSSSDSTRVHLVNDSAGGKIESATEVVKEKIETSACLGVFDFFTLGKSDQVLILGRLKGNLKLGDRLQVCNPGESFESFGALTVEKLSNGKEDSNFLTDEPLAHIVVAASEIAGRLKKGSVLYTSNIDERQLLSSYTDALYTSFVEMQNGDMSNEDYLRASLEDSVEILRLFLWDCRENRQNGSEEEYQKNLAKLPPLRKLSETSYLKQMRSM